MQFQPKKYVPLKHGVSIPQAVWIACNAFERNADSGVEEFQYRKRYGLHAIVQQDWEKEALKFQYRKRYGLHAIS